MLGLVLLQTQQTTISQLPTSGIKDVWGNTVNTLAAAVSQEPAMTQAASSLDIPLLLLLAVTSSGLSAASAQAVSDADDYDASNAPCPPGQFLRGGEVQGALCRVCSPCPTNLIIRRPCAAYDDTVCGPFYEFNDFHQSPGQHGGDLPSQAASAQQRHVPAGSGRNGDSTVGGRQEPDMTSLNPAGDQWRHLALILVSFLSVFSVVVVVFGVVICRLRRRQLREKQVVYEPGFLTSHPDQRSQYMDTFLTSRDHLCYTFLTSPDNAPLFSAAPGETLRDCRAEKVKAEGRSGHGARSMHAPSRDHAYLKIHGDISQV